MLRPLLAQERVESLQGGLVRIVLKRAYADGTQAVEMDPLSLLCRLASSRGPPYWKSTVLRRKALDKIAFQQATAQSTRTAREMCAPASPLLSPRTLYGLARRKI